MPNLKGASGPHRALATSSLGEWIRSTRLSQGVSQRALADRSGVSRSYLCDIERGRDAQPSVATLDKLAAALGASRADLLRAAGVLDPAVGDPWVHEAERRLLALYRDLSDTGRASVERFARFVHREEHQWIQPQLIEIPADGAGTPEPRAHQGGPTLFDELPNLARASRRLQDSTSAAGSGRRRLIRPTPPDGD